VIYLEEEIFGEIADQFYAQYPDGYITGEFVPTPPQFPAVSLIEVDNATFRKSMTSSPDENHAAVMYELNVYSNSKTGKKTECKQIAAFIDTLLLRMNFSRMMLEPVPNADDATIYRMLGRYRAVVGKDNTIYRR
jgi:hypothetical protein